MVNPQGSFLPKFRLRRACALLPIKLYKKSAAKSIKQIANTRFYLLQNPIPIDIASTDKKQCRRVKQQYPETQRRR